MSHNVPAVYDVFLRPIRKNAKHFYGRKKMWRSKTSQRRLRRLVFCVARAADRRRSIYRPVMRSCTVHQYYIFNNVLFDIFFSIASNIISKSTLFSAFNPKHSAIPIELVLNLSFSFSD